MSTYFNYSTGRLESLTRARASLVNVIFDLISDGFDMLPEPNTIMMYGTEAGAADAYVVTLPNTITSYVDGMRISFKASASNTGASTLNVDGVGVKSLTRQSGTALAVGDILINKMVVTMYNSTSDAFEIISNFADVALASCVAAIAAIAAGSAITVSANDTTPGVLNGKAIEGEGIVFTENNDGGNETLTIDTSLVDALLLGCM
jgi:hypothetical protein